MTRRNHWPQLSFRDNPAAVMVMLVLTSEEQDVDQLFRELRPHMTRHAVGSALRVLTKNGLAVRGAKGWRRKRKRRASTKHED